MKINVLLLVMFLLTFGMQGVSYGVALGFVFEEDVTQTIDPTPHTKETTLVDTGDIDFFLRTTKDFTNSFATTTLTVVGDLAEAYINTTSDTMLAHETESAALFTFTIPRTAITDAGVGEYEFTITVTASYPLNVTPGTITLTLTVSSGIGKIPNQTISIVGGNAQEGLVGEELYFYFTVEVIDSETYDLYVDIEVTFVIIEQPTPDAGATLSDESVLTNDEAYAHSALTFGNSPGLYLVEASIGEGDFDRVVFSATAFTTSDSDTDISPTNALTLESVEEESKTTQITETEDETYTLRVTNTGTQSDTINLTLSGDVADAILSQSAIILDAGASQELTLTIPRSALTDVGTYAVTVVATSESDTAVTATIVTNTIVTIDSSDSTTVTDESLKTIIFSEFMFESEGGEEGLPQWIELYNNSSSEKNLRGWKLEWQRLKPSLLEVTTTFKEDFIIPPDQSRLIVTSLGRHSGGGKLTGEDVYQLQTLHAEELAQDNLENRNHLITRGGFSLKLLSPNDILIDHINTITDGAEGWTLPICFINGIRTSVIRRFDEGVPRDGTEPSGWRRAIDAKWLVAGIYYGNSLDLGTPGFRRGKPLPVTLSHFAAKFVNDEVVIKWTTESELNNAGFNILRSTSRTKDFKRINLKMIQGAGTTGQRITYQFIDKTAKPGVTFYYRLEDVDLSGAREILTTYQLRGTITPTGKRIATWASLKSNK